MKVRIFVAAVLSGATLLAPPAVAADTYKVDPVHSSVVFRIKHMGVGYIYGRFDDIAGTVVFDEKAPADSTLEIQVKAGSVDTNNPKRDLHLKSPDFFNAKEFPTIAFKSKQVKVLTPKSYEVTGALTLHGVTKEMTIKLQRVGSAKDPFGNFRTGFEGNVTVRRRDFGMNFMPEAIGDEVWLLIGFEAIKE